MGLPRRRPPLAGHLGLSRAGLGLCGSPLDGADRAVVADYARQLSGTAPGRNQFGTGRVVLYRCHCWCDYCGVISARVVREVGAVRCAEVGYEDERGARGTAAFAFGARQVAAAVSGFLRRRESPAVRAAVWSRTGTRRGRARRGT